MEGNQNMQQQTAEHQQKLLKFVKFMKFHSFEVEDIWDPGHHLTFAQFPRQIQEKTGYLINNHELIEIMKLCSNQSKIMPSDFNPIGLWHKTTNIISKMLPISQQHKHTHSKVKTHPKDNIKSKQTHKKSTLSGQNQPNWYHQKSQYHFQQSVNRNVLETKWDLFVMAAELNQWRSLQNQNAQTDKTATKYKVVNKEEGVKIYRVIQKSEDQITQGVFERIYNKMHKKYSKKINNKNNLKGTVLMVLQESDKMDKNVLQNRLRQRDQELNLQLLKIIRIRTIMQQQNRILKEAMINC